MAKFLIEPHFRLQEWVAEEKGYFRAEGLDYEFREQVRATGGKIHDQGRQGRRVPIVRARPQVERELRLPLDRQCRGLERPRPHVHRRLFGGAGRNLRCRRFSRSKRRPISPACRSRSAISPAAITPPCRRWKPISSPDEIKLNLRRRHAVRAHGEADRRHRAGGEFCSAARIISPSSSASAR